MVDPVRLLIADDHPIVRDGLRAILERNDLIHVVAEAADGHEAVALAAVHRPDIALLDMEMLGLSGLHVAQALREKDKKIGILFLTLYKDRDFFEAALEAGASGYLLKEDPPETVVDAILAVGSGRRYFSPALTLMLVSALPASQRAKQQGDDSLTPTEKRILRLIGLGKTSKEIGADLSLHYRTIENIRTQICRKLNLAGPHALMRYAMHQVQLAEPQRPQPKVQKY